MWKAFLSILEMKLRFEIGRKLLRSSVDRDGSVDQWIEVVFLKRGWTRACLDDDTNSSRKKEIDRVCEDWTKEESLKDFDEE